MTTGVFHGIERFEADLWEAADQLRANSKLTSSDYFMPVLGVIFLRHAANRFDAAHRRIEADRASGRMPKRRILPADYIARRALYLPERARYDWIMQQAAVGGADLPGLVTAAMAAIEEEFEPLQGVLPKDYGIFERQVLEDLPRLFNSEQIRGATGDVFGRIYEYFLAEFSVQKAHDNGEFFTPSSLVQTIVNVIEPDHGTVFDPACGSGGMFVQSSHFIEHEGHDTAKQVVFYGQEKNRDTISIAKMNLAVHGLEGKIAEAITYYQDEHTLIGKCDFVMANPPFNVDLVDAERIKTDPRLPFGLPGVNKQKKVGNGNYLWISYFWSYLNEKGRAGFVMSSQASNAGHGERDVRRKIVESGGVDVMISIRSNFFYTRSVPCELWHVDRGKPADRKDTVLMIDARNVYRKVTRRIYDFSPEQMRNLAAIVWLYRDYALTSGVPHINLGILKRFEIALPDLESQCRIADVLSAYDALIENNRRRMALLEDAARQLYREWFVRLRFPGYEHTRMAQGIPEGWTRNDLQTLCDPRDGIQTGPFGSQLHQADCSDDGIPVVMPKDIVDYRISANSVSRVPEDLANRLGRHRMRVGDTVYGRRGDIGRRSFIGLKQAGWLCGTGCLRIRPNPSVINPRFLFDALGSPETLGSIANRAKGATMPNLNAGLMRSVPVLVPNRSLQNLYAEQVEPMGLLCDSLEEQNVRLAAARDLLLPRLMSGQIKV